MEDEYMYGYVITPEGAKEAMPKPNNEDGTFDLKQLQEAIGGGYVESVSPNNPHRLDKLYFLVDEEGMWPKKLEPNELAATLLGKAIYGSLVVIPEELMG
jgi:hypothetical protein